MAMDRSYIEQEMKCAQSLVEFRKKYLAAENDVEAPEFHHLWSNILLHDTHNYAIEGFRESGKDQIVFNANIMHALTYPVDYRSYIVLIGSIKDVTAAKMKTITRTWLSPEYRELRVNVKRIIDNSGDAFEVLYKNGMRVRIETFGKGGSLRGAVWGVKRPDIVILNDIQDPPDIQSDTICEKDWDWFWSDVYNLGEKSRIFMIGNNLGAKCVIERVIAQADALRFKATRIGIADKLEDNGVTVTVGTPSWPARHTKEYILSEYNMYKSIGKTDIYMREKMCVNMSPLSKPLKSEKLKEFDWHDTAAVNEIKGALVTTVVDPAISKKKGADPSVIATVAETRTGKRYILDISRAKRDPNELVNDIFRIISRWQPNCLGIETVAYQQALKVMFENEQKSRAIPPESIKVVEIRTRQNKELKISGRLQPLLENGLLYIPKNASWNSAFRDEMDAFPDGEHDDMIDTVAMVDDAKTNRLIPTFTQDSIVDGLKIPSNWPRWAALSVRPDGRCIVLIMVCSPEGRLYVTNEIAGNMTPAELFAKYSQVLSGRYCSVMYASKDMFKPDPITGDVWANAYIMAGLPLCPGSSEWRTLLPMLREQFEQPENGTMSRMLICRECTDLIWQLSNAGENDEKRPDFIALRALLLLLAARPSWRDTTNEDMYGGDRLIYPDADIP